MKKIFRMALVLALAGSALLYTGCTKDYDEDINNLSSQIADLKSTHATDVANLQSAINSLKSALETADAGIIAAYKAADENLKKAYEAADADLAAAIDLAKKDIAGNAAAIKALQEDVTALQGDVKDLQDAVAKNAADIQTTIEKTKEADAALDAKIADVQKAVEDLTVAFNDEIAKINGTLAELDAAVKANAAAIAANTSAIDVLRKKCIEVDEALDAAIKAVAKDLADAQDDLDEVFRVLGIVKNELRSIVSVPQLYFAGIEANTYSWGFVEPAVMTAAEKDEVASKTVRYWGWFGPQEETYTVTFPKGTQLSYEIAKEPVTFGQICAAQYDLNPSSFDVATAKGWELVGSNFKYMVRGATWAPKFEGFAGKGLVLFSIENPELLPTSIIPSFDKEEGIQAGEVPSMQLVATLSGDRKISSDFMAVIPNKEMFKALAFASDCEYTTAVKPCDVEGTYELYKTAEDAVWNAPSIEVPYDCGEFDIDNVNVHMVSALDGEYEATVAKLALPYKNAKLNMTYELVDYTVGANKTSQSAFGKIEGSKFIPMVVTADGKSIPAAEAENLGISAVDKQPIVLVKLFADKELILAGYYKIKIVKVEAEPEYFTDWMDMPSFGTLPYICSPKTLATSWTAFSSLVIEHSGVTYEEFLKKYKVVAENTMFDKFCPMPLVQGNSYNCEVYVKGADGKMVATNDFGTIKYTVDAKGAAVNDAFEWSVDKAVYDKIGAGKSQTVYVRFVEDEYNDAFISFTVAIAPAAVYEFDVTSKDAKKWSTMINDEKENTVKFNVKVPEAAGADVNDFSYDLNKLFVAYKPVFKMVKDANYDKVAAAELGITMTYKFAANQPKVAGMQLSTKAPFTTLLADGVEIAKIVGSTIVYEQNATSFKVLNKQTAEDALYAVICMDVVYGKGCAIKAGHYDFYAHFIKPLEITWNEEYTPEESDIDGSNIPVIGFFNTIEDWNNQLVIEKKNGKLVDKVIKDINMFNYYEFKTLQIDLANVEIDNWNDANPTEFKKLNAVDKDAKLELGTVAANKQFTANPEFETAITLKKGAEYSINSLDNVVINYKNFDNVAESFRLKFNVTLNYSWGNKPGTIIVTVKKTEDTTTK